MLTGLSNSFGITARTGAGNTTLTVAGTNTDANYIVDSTVNGLWTVNPATLTVSLTNTGVTKSYDGTSSAPGGFAPTYSVAGFVSGDTAASLTNTGAAYNSAHVATASSITVSGLSISGITGSNGSVAGDYTLSASSASAAATITAAPITVSLSNTNNVTKTYDGTTSAPGGFAPTYSFAGLVAGDSATVSSTGTPVFNSAHVAPASSITQGGISLVSVTGNGTDNSLMTDYVLSNTTAATSNGVASISPAVLSATAPTIGGPTTKVYDGTVAATGATLSGGSVSGAISGDSLTLNTSGVTLAYNSSHVTTASSIGASGGSLSVNIVSSTNGSQTSDYSVSLPAIASVAGSITPATLTASLSNSGVTKTYDGTSSAPAGFTPTYSFTGLASGDTGASLSNTGAAYNSPQVVGATGVTVSGLSLSSITGSNGSQTSDYAFSTGSVSVAAAITPYAFSFTIGNDSQTYGSPANLANDLPGTISTGLNGQTLAIAYSSTGNTGAANIGGYAINGALSNGTGLSSNYAVTLTAGTLTVNRASLLITATAQSKVYGSSANLGSTGFISSGLVTANGDSVTGVTLASSGAASTAGVGNYNIVASAAQGSGLTNYAISYATGSLTVNTANLVITASNQSATYGVAANLGTTGFTTTGLVTANGDTVTGVTLASSGAASTANVGNYSIITSAAVGNGLTNYAISYATGSLTVNTANLVITASNQSKTYGTTASLGTTGFTATGLVTANGDTLTGVTLASTGAASTANVGNYSIIVSAAVGSGLTNYAISYATGSLTVNTANLVITASNQSKTYGTTASLGSTGFTATGLVTANGDTLTGVTLASSGAASTAGVGNYNIVASAAQGSGLTNYAISYATGSLTVNTANLVITASNQSATYGVAANLGTTGFTTTGLVTANGDTVTGVTLASSGAASTANVGNYSIIASAAVGNGLTNYTVSYATGILTINPANLVVVITAANQSKTYGTVANLGSTAFTAAGLVNSDKVTSVTLTSSGAAATAAAGNYSIVASAAQGSGLSNYTLSYTSGTLTVNPANLVITASNQSATYGAAASLGGSSFTATGLANGDKVTSVALASSGAAATAGAGNYSIVASAAQGSGLSNYTLSYTNGALTVNPANLVITAGNQTRVAGNANPFLSYSITTGALFNGDTLSGGLATGANSNSSAGTYPITQGTLVASANYTLNYIPGTLTVTAQPSASANFVAPSFSGGPTSSGGGGGGGGAPGSTGGDEGDSFGVDTSNGFVTVTLTDFSNSSGDGDSLAPLP